ncbi:MAG: small ribosomal subunit Rsm22 family protein [Chloroflexota bacterium]
MELPAELAAAIAAELALAPVRSLAKSATDLSHRYRAGNAQPAGGRFLTTPDDVAAYAAYRLPATHAAVTAALVQAQDRLPGWTPHSLLDVGAGPGTAMWAAAAVWPGIERVTLLERDDAMIALGRRLAGHAPQTAIRAAAWQRADITGDWDVAPHDLVIISYALGELPEERCAPLIGRLWERTAGLLVIIEPGSAAGFARVKAARAQLLAAGAHAVAPCPHSSPCPLPADDWCHFSQRLARSALHRRVKDGALPYEDEKFSFACLSRTPGLATAGRVIRHPQVRPGHIHFRLCTGAGLVTRTVTRKERELFRIARDLRWGSVMPDTDADHDPGGNQRQLPPDR